MSKVGFDGYSIAEVLEFTRGLRLFRFMGAGKGFNGNPQELSFRANFKSKDVRDKTLENLQTVWESLAGSEPYRLIAFPNPVDHLRADISICIRHGGFELADFEFVKLHEPAFIDVLSSGDTEINDPPEFPSRGFDRSRYEG
jgi:hypothetical protein